MKKWIHSATDIDQSILDDEYYSTTPRNEVEFDHDVIWSVQFYEKGVNLLYKKEVYVLGTTFKEARAQAIKLAEAWDFPTDLSHCVVQYAYLPIRAWNKLNKDTCNGVDFGCSSY